MIRPPDLDVLLMREAANRLRTATTLQDRLAAIDFGRDQTREASERALNITQRLMPAVRSPNGFFDREGFIAARRRMDRREALRKEVRARLLAKIVARDGLLAVPAEERRLAA